MNARGQAVRHFRSLEQLSETHHVGAARWAIAYIGIGGYEQALQWLRRIDEERNPEDALYTTHIAINMYHIPELNQPEFVEIRERLALRR